MAAIRSTLPSAAAAGEPPRAERGVMRPMVPLW